MLEIASSCFAWLGGDDCRLFTTAVTLSDDVLSAMLTAGKGLLSTLATLKRAQACQPAVLVPPATAAYPHSRGIDAASTCPACHVACC